MRLIIRDFMDSKEWLEILDVVIRSILSLVSLFIVTKMLGKKQVSQLSLFDYVIGISIGNFAAEATINLESGYLHGIVAVFMFGFVAYLVSFGTMKSMRLRRFFMGVPTVLIQDGKMIEKNFEKMKFDMNDILEVARTNGYFDISQVDYAIMEANGQVSFLLKGEYLPVTISDMNLKAQKQGLCANLIIDGKIIPNNLKGVHKTEKWLQKELKVRGYKELDNILLATLDVNEKLVIYDKNPNLDPLEILE